MQVALPKTDRCRCIIPAFIAVLAFLAVVAAIDPAGSYPDMPQGPGLTTDEMFNAEEGVRLVATLPDFFVGRLTLRAQPLAKPADEELQQALLDWVRAQGLAVLNWEGAAEQLRVRLQCAQAWLPEAECPAMDEEPLLAALEQWLLPSLNGVRDLGILWTKL